MRTILAFLRSMCLGLAVACLLAAAMNQGANVQDRLSGLATESGTTERALVLAAKFALAAGIFQLGLWLLGFRQKRRGQMIIRRINGDPISPHWWEKGI